MSFGVFIHRPDSTYRDSPAEYYQFPRIYLRRVEACVGDWIVYYEPTKVAASRGYFAIAKVERVVPDPAARDRYLALMEPGSYLDFANPVPFADVDGVVERGLVQANGSFTGGNTQAAVRSLSAEDFNRITARGLDEGEPLLPRIGSPLKAGFEEEQTPFAFEQERTRVASLTSRLVRDPVFRRVVLRAYGERCAITGLKLINGGGRAEVEAAHIRPVERGGPDIVSNGLALSGTAHWMFDRGLITLADDLTVMISRHVNDQHGVRSFINPTGRALVPARVSDQPHPHFLRWHRENGFKQ